MLPLLFEASTSEPLFFEIVDMNLRRKKLVRTASITALKRMAFPVSAQHFGTWQFDGQSTRGHDVYADGFLALVDVLDLAPWPVLRAGLRRWRRMFSDVQGCECIGQSMLLSDTEWDLWTGSVPVLELLDRLRDSGWMLGPALALHTLKS